MDDVSLSSVGRLFQMTAAADTANHLVPTTVNLVRCTDSFMMSAERKWRGLATVETKIQSSAKKTLEDDHGDCIRCRMVSQWRLFINHLINIIIILSIFSKCTLCTSIILGAVSRPITYMYFEQFKPVEPIVLESVLQNIGSSYLNH